MLRRLFPIALSLAVAGAALAQSITVNAPVGKPTPGATSVQGQVGMNPVVVSCPDGTCTSPIYVTDGGTVINIEIDGGSVFVNNDGGHPVPISCPDGTTSCFAGGGGGGGNVVVTNDAGNPVPVAFQNDAGNPIYISGSISATNPSVGVTGASVPSSATYIGMIVGGNLVGLAGTASGLKVDGSAVTQPISASALPLPTGAATLAAQNTGNTSLASILTTLGSPMQQTGGSVTAAQGAAAGLGAAWPVELSDGTNLLGTSGHPLRVDPTGTTTQPVSVASLPLPSGASTAALQTTGNTTLSTINTTLGSPFQAGGSIGNTSFAATQATASLLNATVVGTTSAGAGASSGLVTIQGNSGGTAVPISAASLPLPAGASTAAGLTTINTTLGSPFQAGGSIGNTSFGISGTLPAFAATPTFQGPGTAGTPSGGVLSVQGVAGGTAVPISGSVTVSGTATVTQGAAAALSGYWPVGLSDGTNLLGVSAHPVRTDPTGTTTQPVALPTSATASTAGTCTSLTTSTQILASNAARHGAILTALSSNANRARYAFAASATASQMPLEAGSSLPLDATYTGPVSFITDTGGSAITICALEY